MTARRRITLCQTAGARHFLLSLLLGLSFVVSIPSLSAQQPDATLTLDAALAYARQHSPRLAARKQSIATRQAAVAAAQAERLPKITLGAAARVSSQPTETAMGFPSTQLSDIPEGQPYRRSHLNAALQATLPLYTGGTNPIVRESRTGKAGLGRANSS